MVCLYTTRTRQAPLLKCKSEVESNPENVAELFEHMRRDDFLAWLARSIHLLPFEARKDSQAIFSSILRFRPGGSTAEDTPALSYVIHNRPEILIDLCRGYTHRDSALPCGMVLREILKHESVTAIIMYDQSLGDGPAISFDEVDTMALQSGNGIFWEFFKWIDEGAFEVSADAFTTFRVNDDGYRLYGCSLTVPSGYVDEAQTACRPIPEQQLRTLFWPIQYSINRIKFVCYQEAVYQAPWRDTFGQGQLRCHDRIHHPWRQSKAMHEPVAGR